MTYAKWKEVWRGDPPYGFGPEQLAAERGDNFCGHSYLNNGDIRDYIIGEVNDDVDVSAYAEWQLEKMTAEEVLAIWIVHCPEYYIDDNGRIAVREPGQP